MLLTRYNRLLIILLIQVIIVGVLVLAHVDDHDKPSIDTFTDSFSFEHPININVRLVGFSTAQHNDLQRILNHLDNTNIPVIKNPFSTVQFIKQKYLYFLETSSDRLKDDLRTAISDATRQQRPHPTIGAGTTVIGYDIIDSIIASDYNLVDKNNAYTIYILNNDISQSYSYSQIPNLAQADKQQRTPFYCTTKMWQCRGDGGGRYMWIDLTADAVNFGPVTKGTGSVIASQLPRHASGSSDRFLNDIGTFVHQTTRQLIAPPIGHMMNFDWTHLEVRLIMVHDHKVGILEQSERFDWDEIRKQLKSIKLLPDQSISFSKAEISLLDNIYAAQAKQSSLRVHHSGTKGTQQYLDSADLHYWLQQHNLDFVPELDNRNSDSRVIPVFLFDISFKDLLLLDRMHQAVSFDDMVIAIQTQSQRPVDFTCGEQGNLSIDADDATRPVMAALLETIWGVLPTHLELSKTSGANQNDANYLWSMGFNPFSVFSTHKTLSFAQTDAAIRNNVYSHIVESLESLQIIMSHIDQDETWEEFAQESDKEDIQSIDKMRQSIQEVLLEIGQHLSKHKEVEAYAKIQTLQTLAESLTDVIHSQHNERHSFLECRQPSIVMSEVVSIIFTCLMLALLSFKFLKNKMMR
ncbi:hypothetical protein SAMD00019534_082520 [Acytostelium subglobosum LB1]|uniref:hypothetical protein n=1 Tax=Acytostelium subglobosum LB1 TaxID=1410327 RepID=UPI000644F548|nr:hypothetical protein SAMD00019534_082520 [Acytostelium subglobosum LB1]GAM25077.1 hypothetical protein SAMD00019534_082520 [Acytostelium subglobosum LB1]|eukprot:XP_012752166.1 hypothetical protein SAMD00019534_082520 [Acytostelium subglobosum LB1]